MKIIKGDLIELALQGEFDVIAHGCNCFCTQGAGIAKKMSEYFYTNNSASYPSESLNYKGNIGKLGNIETTSLPHYVKDGKYFGVERGVEVNNLLSVYNMYTQYNVGRDLSYSALELCLKKLAHETHGKKVGLPLVGGGIAGGSIYVILERMKLNFHEEDLTVVIYDENHIETIKESQVLKKYYHE